MEFGFILSNFIPNAQPYMGDLGLIQLPVELDFKCKGVVTGFVGRHLDFEGLAVLLPFQRAMVAQEGNVGDVARVLVGGERLDCECRSVTRPIQADGIEGGAFCGEADVL